MIRAKIDWDALQSFIYSAPEVIPKLLQDSLPIIAREEVVQNASARYEEHITTVRELSDLRDMCGNQYN